MNKPIANNASSAVEVTEIFETTAANPAFEFFDQDLVPLPSSHALKGKQIVIRLDGALLVFYSTNVRVRTRPSLQKNFAAFATFGVDSRGTINGLPVRHDMVLAVPARQSIAVVAEPGYESASILIDPTDLMNQLSTQGQREAPPLLQRVEVLHAEPALAGNLFKWIRHMVMSAVENQELFETSAEHRAAAKQDMLETLLSTLATSSRMTLERRDRTRLIQSDIVRAAEQYAMAHTSDRIYVKDLCQAAGVSERSLEYAFRAEMGLSPTAYLTRIRLHRVRETLLQGSVANTTVTNEALRWGFWHFGEFAKAYKECFQELPSDTLRRAQGV